MTRWHYIFISLSLLTTLSCASFESEVPERDHDSEPVAVGTSAGDGKHFTLKDVADVESDDVGDREVADADDGDREANDDDDEDDDESLADVVEDFEEGFCADDIYAQYLMERYRAEHTGHKLSEGKTEKRSSRSRRNRREDARYFKNHSSFAALAYAHSVMAGPTSPYLGAIPIVINDKVDFWVHYFKTSGRGMFMRWLVRGETIKPQVQPILQDSGVPMEFFYLAMIESGLSNHANSRARDIGTWQFMRGTAKLYGLKINHWVDERRDPTKSTLAAARYLKELYLELGDWHLAMAAYNAGPGRVRRAIKTNGNADFWKLCEDRVLAKETKEYVPKVLAAILLAADPEAHGFRVHSTEVADAADTTVLIKRPVRLDEIANRLGLSLRTLKNWNPELLRNMTPPTRGGYPLRLSAAYASRFPQLEPRLTTADIKSVGMHTVRSGDTFGRIARQYGIPVRQLMELNPDVAAKKLKPGVSILVPAIETVSTVNAGNPDLL